MFITIRTVRTITPALKRSISGHRRSIHSLWMYARTRARLAIRIATAAAKIGENRQLEHRRRHFGRFAVRRLQKVCQHQIVEDMEHHGPADGILHRHISQHQSHQKRVGRLQQVPVEQPEQERGTQDGKPLCRKAAVTAGRSPGRSAPPKWAPETMRTGTC